MQPCRGTVSQLAVHSYGVALASAADADPSESHSCLEPLEVCRHLGTQNPAQPGPVTPALPCTRELWVPSQAPSS